VTEPDDQPLLSDLRAGRPEACAELIRAHYQEVYRFLVHMTRDIHRAEDLTQETFASAWEKIAGYQGRATLTTWLHRIAYTKFIDAQRAQRRIARMIEKLAVPAVSASDPTTRLVADDEAGSLYRTLQSLAEADRTLIVLHYLQGLSYREMAGVLDEPTGTVKWRTSEALSRLRTLLCEEVSEHALGHTSGPGPIS
jgi:RNA polymerase sigma-70 factor (ECF subfamily)